MDPGLALVIDTVDDVTPAWLNQVLRRAGSEANVVDVSTAPVGTGQMASTFRVTALSDGAEVPLSLVVKLPNAPGQESAQASGQRCEAAFYREVADRLPIATPECFFADSNDSGTRFTLLLADASPAQQGDQIAGCTIEQASTAAAAIAGLHAPTWCDPSLDDLGWVISGRPGPEPATGLAALLADATESFIAELALPAEAAQTLRRSAETAPVWAAGRSTAFALCHGDYRLDNLLFPPADQPQDSLQVVDWAVMSVGLPQRDLALLIAPGMQPALRRESERALVDTYHQRLVELGVAGYTAEACWDDYRLGLFYNVIVTVLGWAFSRRTERGDAMFRLMAERMTLALMDNDAFAVL